MKNTAWTNVESGQIVSFRYKSEDGRSVNRTVLCLDPEFRYRKKSTGRIVQFFIGLELYASDKQRLQVSVLNQLFKLLGGGDLSPRQTSAQELEQMYRKLKGFLARHPIFKTYFLRKCRKNRVFLENKYKQLNGIQMKRVSENITKQKDTINILESNLED
jgi:hypothetical protein|tara:strand:+ start:1102 stop:1581 length:480 start_codon:yes stop_codon:yes gene_type:complete